MWVFSTEGIGANVVRNAAPFLNIWHENKRSLGILCQIRTDANNFIPITQVSDFGYLFKISLNYFIHSASQQGLRRVESAHEGILNCLWWQDDKKTLYLIKRSQQSSIVSLTLAIPTAFVNRKATLTLNQANFTLQSIVSSDNLTLIENTDYVVIGSQIEITYPYAQDNLIELYLTGTYEVSTNTVAALVSLFDLSDFNLTSEDILTEFIWENRNYSNALNAYNPSVGDFYQVGQFLVIYQDPLIQPPAIAETNSNYSQGIGTDTHVIFETFDI